RGRPCRPSAVGLLVGLANGRGDATAVVHLVAVLLRPGADGRGVLAAGRRGTRLPSARGAASGTTTVLHVRLEKAAELVRISGGEIDLVRLAVQRERHGLVRLAAVEVVDKKDLNLLCHRISFRRYLRDQGVPASAVSPAPVICSTAVRRKANRFCRKNTNPRQSPVRRARPGNMRVSDIGHRTKGAGGGFRDDHRCRSIRLLPRVFGFTRSRPRNSATPSS